MQESRAAGPTEFQPPPSVPVERYAEVRKAWTSPHLSAALGGPGEELFHKDTVLRLDGAHHLARRRTLGELLKRRGHERFRDRYLYPTARAALATALADPDPDGVVRVDLVPWGRRVNFQLSAMLVGYDEAMTPEGADELYEVMEAAFKARPGARQVALGEFDPDSDQVRQGLKARQELIDRFYTPAITRRREWVAKVQAAEMDESELPQDMLTIVARGVHEDYDDPAIAERDALFLFAAAVDTTASSLVWVLQELFEWFEAHPEDRELTGDDEFLLGAVNEALRLHPVTPGHPRLAVEDVTLEGGTEIPAGAMAMILPHRANTDPEVWGPDAREYDPRRGPPAPGIKAHGFAFGGGPHMCWGAPLVMGSGGVDGSLVFLTRMLLEAGVRADPDGPKSPSGPETRGEWAERTRHFPVILGGPPAER